MNTSDRLYASGNGAKDCIVIYAWAAVPPAIRPTILSTRQDKISSTYICLKGGKATDTVKYMQITARGPGSGRPRTGGISWSRIDVVLVLFQFFSKVRR